MDENSILKPGESIKPHIDIEEVKKLAEDLYGFKCLNVTEINAYDDRNFKLIVKEFENNFLQSVCQNGYVFKVVNTMDSKKLDILEAQNSLLLFLINKGFSVPNPVKNKNGKYYSSQDLKSGNHIIRVFEFISGEILADVPATKQLLTSLGEYVANFDNVLRNFSHPSIDKCQSLWMLEMVPEVANFLFAIKDTSKRKVFEEILDEFSSKVMPIKNNFEPSIIHGDFNQHNIIVEAVDGEWKVKGILDFTDSHWGCFLFELAITMTYAMMFAKDIEAGKFVLAGYSKVRKIPNEEFEFLKICICGRLCQSLVMGAYSHLQDETNEYVLATAEEGWKLLEKFWKKSNDELISSWKEYIENPSF